MQSFSVVVIVSDSTINFHPHTIPISNTDVDSSINEEKKYKDK